MSKGQVTFLALGDIWLARQVAEEIARQGARHPFHRIAPFLKGADVVLGNLESPVSTGGSPQRHKDVVARAHPEALEGLSYAGIGLVSLANNHIMDYGPEALGDTLRFLDQREIGHFGAGMRSREAREPYFYTRHDLRLAFHAYLCWGEASRRSIGPAGLDRSLVAQELKDSRRRADFVITVLHGGVMFQDAPTLEMIRLAHWIIDQGADIVIGHHPHVIQGIERYKNGLIAYSLGNFLFDSYEHELPDERVRQGMILKIDLRKDGSPNYRYQPIPIRMADGFQVELVPDGQEKERMLERLNRLSRSDILSESRGRLPVDEIDLRDKVSSLLSKGPSFLIGYIPRNFFRILRHTLPALFRLTFQKPKKAKRDTRANRS